MAVKVIPIVAKAPAVESSAERQKEHDCQGSLEDWVKNWVLKRKKYPPPTEEPSERYSSPENSGE